MYYVNDNNVVKIEMLFINDVKKRVLLMYYVNDK